MNIEAEMNIEDFSNEPLTEKYLHAYHSQQHYLNNVIGVEEASKLWGLSPGTIKNYCADGKIIAKKSVKHGLLIKTNQILANQKNHKMLSLRVI